MKSATARARWLPARHATSLRLAARLAAAILAFALVPLAWGQAKTPDQRPQSPSLPSLLPFSTPLLRPGRAQEARLERLVRQLRTVQRAEVLVTEGPNGPEVLVLVQWRRDRPDPDSIALIRSLALRTVTGLQEEGLSVADFSGRMYIRRGQSLPDHLSAQPPQPRPRPWWPVLLTILLLAAAAASVWRFWPRCEPLILPGDSAPRAPAEVLRALDAASPAVRGAVLALAPEDLGTRARRRWPEGIDTPDTAMRPDVAELVVAAVLASEGDDGNGT